MIDMSKAWWLSNTCRVCLEGLYEIHVYVHDVQGTQDWHLEVLTRWAFSCISTTKRKVSVITETHRSHASSALASRGFVEYVELEEVGIIYRIPIVFYDLS